MRSESAYRLDQRINPLHPQGVHDPLALPFEIGVPFEML
jgi:hypothetical protein